MGTLSELLDGFEPHGTIYLAGLYPCTDQRGEPARVSSGGVPGVGTGWVYREGYWEGYTGTHQDPPRTIFNHILASGPYPRPNEGNSSVFHEVSRMGLE